MTGTVNDGYIDIAALRTDGTNVVEFVPFELFAYKDQTIKELIFKTYEEARKWNFAGTDPEIFTVTEKKITEEQSAAIEVFINKNNIKKNEISCVGFHGLTVLHRPVDSNNKIGKTRQLGNGQMM